MYQLTYISTAHPGIGEGDIDAILASSRKHNSRNGVTGILVYDGKRFLQALEGEQAAVEATYLRIKADPRHRAAVQLSLRDVDAREFGTWDMAAHRSSAKAGDRGIIDDVDAMVASVPDANTRALFSSFARLKR
jgi:hypothetical protein